MAKITRATVNKFIKPLFAEEKIFINIKSSFSGMIDCCIPRLEGFKEAVRTNKNFGITQGIDGAWFVGCSRDYFDTYEDETYKGFQISNSCGSFIIARKK